MNSISKTLECPFTWQIDESLVRNFDETEELGVDVDEEPVLAFMKSIMMTFMRAKNGYYDAARIKNRETNEICDKMDLEQIKKEGISTEVLQHVKQATEYHLYRLVGNQSAAAVVMDALVDSCTLNSSDRDRSTLEGCKSIAWQLFYEAHYETGLQHAERAASGSPDCPLWHYLRAKGYRYERQSSNFSRRPSEKERQAFLRCRELSSRPFYALYVATMHKEAGDEQISRTMYLDIYEECMRKPEATYANIMLRLALMFIRATLGGGPRDEDCDRAKACLDRVEKIMPENSTFLHYKGKFYMKIRYFTRALGYLKDASINTNYSADLDLAVCKKKLDRKFDYIPHFRMMLMKYKLNPRCKQQILLHIGMHYHFRRDYINAAKYLLEAIEFNIDHDQLKEFRNVMIDWKGWNIFNFVCEELLPRLRYISSTASADVLKLIDNLTSYCEPRQEARQDCYVQSFNNMNLK